MIGCLLVAQDDSFKTEILNLAHLYQRNYAVSDKDEDFALFDSIQTKELEGTVVFLRELVKENNALATLEFLTKPDSSTLHNLFFLR